MTQQALSQMEGASAPWARDPLAQKLRSFFAALVLRAWHDAQGDAFYVTPGDERRRVAQEAQAWLSTPLAKVLAVRSECVCAEHYPLLTGDDH